MVVGGLLVKSPFTAETEGAIFRVAPGPPLTASLSEP